jgi:glycosyltransferase involved in cell wall biosynthesis
MQLSGCVMTKNSLRTLAACLDSIERFCDEVVVVDDGSTDGTWDYLLERRQGGKIRPLRRALDTFASQRRWMVSQAKGEWVLIVDADEEALPGLGDEVLGVLASKPARDAFYVPQKNVLPAHWPKPVWFWTSQKRLLRKERVRWDDSNWVHVPALHHGKAGRLRHGLLHHSYDSVMHLLKKQLYYAQSGSRHWTLKKTSGFSTIVLRTLSAFVKYYFVKGLVRFGTGGFVVAFSLAVHGFSKYALLWEANLGAVVDERGAVPGEGDALAGRRK